MKTITYSLPKIYFEDMCNDIKDNQLMICYKNLLSLTSVKVAFLSISSVHIIIMFCEKLKKLEVLAMIFSFTFVSDTLKKNSFFNLLHNIFYGLHVSYKIFFMF